MPSEAATTAADRHAECNPAVIFSAVLAGASGAAGGARAATGTVPGKREQAASRPPFRTAS